MTTRSLLTGLILLGFSSSVSAQETKHSNVHIGFVYPLSTNGVRAGEYSNNFSIHALIGVSGSEEGACLSGFSSIIKDSAKGFVASGFSNHILHGAKGVQLTGFMNTIGKNAIGLQAAGFTNITGNAKGFQAAGFANIAAGNVNGVQAAGFINESKDVNTQAAGFINVAHDVKGVQLAGFINIAGKVKGAQIAGFINIADSCDYPIGIINIVKNGEKSIGFSIDETLTTLVTFRSGGKKLYGILGAGYNFKSGEPLYAMEAGMGLHIPLSRYFRINIEGTGMNLTDFYEGVYFKSSARTLLSMRAGRSMEVYLGPTFNYMNYSNEVTGDLVNNYIWHDYRYGNYYGLYIGGIAGINILF